MYNLSDLFSCCHELIENANKSAHSAALHRCFIQILMKSAVVRSDMQLVVSHFWAHTCDGMFCDSLRLQLPTRNACS